MQIQYGNLICFITIERVWTLTIFFFVFFCYFIYTFVFGFFHFLQKILSLYTFTCTIYNFDMRPYPLLVYSIVCLYCQSNIVIPI